MKKFALSAVLVIAVASPAAAQNVSLRVITPAVTANAGLRDLAAGFEKEMGVHVDIVTLNMAKMADELKTGAPPADIVFLPYALMDQAQTDKNVASGSRINIGRVRIGIAIHKGDPVPDISTVEKVAAYLKSADSVMYSNPKSGSMEARIIDDMLNSHPEFAGVKRKISMNGEGGQAVSRGEGQMALQLECEIVNHPDQLTDVGPVPDSLGAHIDSAAAVSARAAHPREAAQFLKYATQPGTYSLWLGKGLERAKN
ncbi:MAG TPA: substrate-binding domain-containing protein [Rhizomicrobium sp.]|jgi:molybdate transport system substrate-binding protein|nr:substrate-binding domain-containing protein [Rhizomicrobium sp.]